VAAAGAEGVSGARLLAALLAAWTLAACAGRGPVDPAPPVPSLAGFEDAIHHWRNVHGDRYPRHAPDQVAAIADNILLYQRASGGWKENEDPARILDDAGRAQFAAEAAKPGGSFDNRNTYTQLDYLATAHALTGDARYRDGSLRALEFTLARQVPQCGGWPHTVPARESYHGHVTIADDVTAGVLGTLRTVLADTRRYGFVDAPLRARVRAAVERGDACLLRLQVRRGDALAGWAGQYNPATLRPAQGRAFELPSITTQETVGVLRYLMSIPTPSPEVVAAVDGGVDWLRRVELAGWRLETFDAPPEQYQHHRSDSDRRLVAEPGARGLWARFYDLADDGVVLANRDGVRVPSYQDVPRERRTGYAWYGDWPRAVFAEHARWKAALAARAGQGG
jgi:PelA/Pel-15E family pectate lyase